MKDCTMHTPQNKTSIDQICKHSVDYDFDLVSFSARTAYTLHGCSYEGSRIDKS